MADPKEKETEIWRALQEYCQQVRYGEIKLIIKVHQGKALEYEELETRRKFKAETGEKKT